MDGRVGAALGLAHRALRAVEAHARAGHLRCPVCGALADDPRAADGAPAHAADCALALALAALGDLLPGETDA